MRKYLIYLLVLLGGAILTQSFQCASMNVSSARNKIKQKKYPEAIELLNKELKVNPSNEDALDLLYDVYDKTNQTEKQLDILSKWEKAAKEPKDQQQVSLNRYQLWAKCYSSTISYYNKGIQDKKYLDSALYFSDMGIKTKPNSTLLYPIKGTILENMNKQTEALKVFKDYVELISPKLDIMSSKKLYIGTERSEIISTLGQPNDTKTTLKPGSQDSIIVDVFEINGKEAYLGFEKKFMDDKASFFSFKYDMPENWLEQEKYAAEEFDITPLSRLADISFKSENFDDAIKYAQMMQQTNPNDAQLNKFVIACYQRAGKIDQALEKMKSRIKNDPQDFQTRTQYADLLANEQKTEEAIYQYKQALAVEPNYPFALRNLASSYKNLASNLQKKENEKYDQDSKYERDFTEVKEVLTQSAESFEAALKTEEFKGDPIIIAELVNIYDYQDNKAKLKEYLTQLEGLESTITDEADKQAYYLQLVRIYSNLKETEKLKAIQAKIK